MNRNEAVALLRAAGVPEQAYGFDTVARDDAYILYREAPDRWAMFYTERGLRHSLQYFDSEDVACRAFVAWVLDATAPTSGVRQRTAPSSEVQPAGPMKPASRRPFHIGRDGLAELRAEEASGHA